MAKMLRKSFNVGSCFDLQRPINMLLAGDVTPKPIYGVQKRGSIYWRILPKISIGIDDFEFNEDSYRSLKQTIHFVLGYERQDQLKQPAIRVTIAGSCLFQVVIMTPKGRMIVESDINLSLGRCLYSVTAVIDGDEDYLMACYDKIFSYFEDLGRHPVTLEIRQDIDFK